MSDYDHQKFDRLVEDVQSGRLNRREFFDAGFGVSGGTTEQDVAIAETAFQGFEASH